MEQFDVVIIGGGSAGLAALKQLSSVGIQTVLLEAGSTIGTKNVSGGILYSKNPQTGKVHNVDEIFENFLEEKPWERQITKYILNCVSKDKVLSIDLTDSHDYQSNFGCSVLLNKLNSWFAKQSLETAEKNGGGIISGVHVRNITWDNERGKTIIQTDELDDFEAKAVIASDGVNSEVAEITGARKKFLPPELYQGVKVVIKLPEEIIEERFQLNPGEGTAHIFAGDITLDHIGGGFLYTNLDSLSAGVVYHYDSLLSNPTGPNNLINALLNNPFVKEYIKDEVALEPYPDKTLTKMEQLRIKFAVNKLIKKWENLRFEYYSHEGKKRFLEDKEFNSIEDAKSKIDSIHKELLEKYNTRFETDYVELEYSTKLIPDGKRCRMKKPYIKNILFIGDAAGRGLFIGPRIEGLNVGIDDAARASNAIKQALEKNNLDVASNYLGELYSQSVQQSPYTMDMERIDKHYIKTIIDAAGKQIPSEKIGKHKFLFKLFLNDKLRNVSIDIVNKIGYNNMLSLIESKETYINTPINIAEKLGTKTISEYSLSIPELSQRISSLSYNDDPQSHIKITNSRSEFMKKMVTLCPTKCYSLEGEEVVLQHEGCIECGTCSPETEWRHPRGEKGIQYKYG
ncbi:putative oxidoreductase FixC [Candidatus Nitrosocosmicus oleophilus]|uniref:Putative oxidoreductase FixC n=1 Tax=Candidatus Nitrosocosmicus oleophilus TaxID=1353260 RepID=A0A654M4E7_9ARCH|nr:electron transfer flavoprotein [Candidatus Nitrosocosmicus oleophilus]ALI37369.1 putative oxidoreductase FixC [Candidatus Nitrosocosmicus oleophilus]